MSCFILLLFFFFANRIEKLTIFLFFYSSYLFLCEFYVIEIV